MKMMHHGKKKAQKTSFAGSTRALTRGRWYTIKYWCHQRPCWGAFCVLAAGLLILWAPVCLLQSTIVTGSTLWAGLVVGGLLFAMGLVELFAPSQALVAGAIGVVLSLISLITALGGLGVGMFLGVIGSSYVIAWRPQSGSRPVFWSVFGCSMTVMLGMVALITRGTLAVAAPIAGPYTSTTGRSECHNVHAVPAISRVDHRTPVLLSHSDICVASNVVITQHVLGKTITITQARVTSRGVTSETVASRTGSADDTKGAISAANGFTEDIAVTRDTNVTAHVLFSYVESVKVSGISFSIA